MNLEVILFVFFGVVLNYSTANVVHKRFEYKYSFKPPYLAQKDGSVPFWEYAGNAIASSENVRLAPSLRSQKGAIWTKNPINFDWWDVDISFRVTGRGRIGADGLAFWYTQNKGSVTGEVFGSSDQWVGLGLFFDSFDNDNKHNNPYIMAVLNDGTKQFDHQNDGITQQLAGCLRDFRNKPFPTRARIEYYQNTLTVLFHNGRTNSDEDYEMCLRAENVVLPKGGYFGVSAATGGLADDHDVIHFLTSSLHPPDQVQQNQFQGEEQQKLQQEYQDYQQKLEAQKAEYKKEHPDVKEPEVEDWYESDSQRELRQIFQGQNQIYEVLRELNKKIDEVVGRQERTMSLISQQASMVQAGGAPPPPPGAAPVQPGETIRRHEVDALFNNHNQISGYLQELKQFVLEVKTRADTILNNQAKQPTAQVQSVGYDTQSLISEMRDGLNHVKQNIAQLSQKTPTTQGCPTVSCISLTAVLAIAAVQLGIILAYNIYRDNKDSSNKKFY
ncbi:protein ERGIC-53 [Diabrotica virgifera virgifera]|uniref:Protein ERGIC-53 n=1 Tax=Diabrotica virgifera virgifera TaxID=50390 RepID=A0A6P7HDE7_DIAVI|nr:protein ERGIC-53 [Diabrotica virgifera virgifera]